MIKIILPLVLLTGILLLFPSCSDTAKKEAITIKLDSIIYKPGTKEPLTGTWTDSINGMKMSFEVINGKKEGSFKTWYANGNLQMTGQLKENRNIGEWKYYYDNGSVESYGNFVNDKPEGLWYWFYPDSILRQTGYFHEGERDSVWKTYDETGLLKDSVEITDSTLHLPGN